MRSRAIPVSGQDPRGTARENEPGPRRGPSYDGQRIQVKVVFMIVRHQDQIGIPDPRRVYQAGISADDRLPA
jgi:hypothetical protein